MKEATQGPPLVCMYNTYVHIRIITYMHVYTQTKNELSKELAKSSNDDAADQDDEEGSISADRAQAALDAFLREVRARVRACACVCVRVRVRVRVRDRESKRKRVRMACLSVCLSVCDVCIVCTYVHTRTQTGRNDRGRGCA
jgi:hypothetical protein